MVHLEDLQQRATPVSCTYVAHTLPEDLLLGWRPVLDKQPGWTIRLPQQRKNYAIPRVTSTIDLLVGLLGTVLVQLLL